MQITYKCRLYPTKEDEDKLSFVLEVCRLLYNNLKALRELKKNGRKVGKLRYGIKFFLRDSDGDDFLHKLSRFYVDNYDFVSIEDLNIKGMTRNHHLAQSILDASWSRFFGMLDHDSRKFHH